MLGPGRYLLGVVEILALLGFAWLGATRARGRLAPAFSGATGYLATAVIAAALLLWTAQLLGSFSLLAPVPYLLLVAVTAMVLRMGIAAIPPAGGVVGGTTPEDALATGRGGGSPAATGPAGQSSIVPCLIAIAVATIAVLRFAVETKSKLGTGMTGFDTTWYHGPFAAGFFQSGDTWDLHFIAPQFLAWFYPANAEIFHAAGMLAFGRDLLSPLLNLGWFVGCLVACWCIGRPYRVAPWSLALGAVALSLPVLSDQAGEMRNDIVGIFFLLAAVALALDARGRGNGDRTGAGGASLGAIAVVGLAAGLAAGTKLNFLLPAAVLVLGAAALAPAGRRWRTLLVGGLAAVAGGGYWYLRNLLHSGNPLPWFDSLGPISLPAPDQALGGREAHSVLAYLTDGAVWGDWFGPGLRDGLTALWPMFAIAAAAGLLLALLAVRGRSWEGRDAALALAGLVGLAAALAWLVAPTSASGPEGMPRGFESGLRYLAPALVLALALLPTVPPLRNRLPFVAQRATNHMGGVTEGARSAGDPRGLRTGIGGWGVAGIAAALLLAVAVGYPVQRYYLDHRYAEPTFAAPGLNAAFEWARDFEDSRIATTSTRQYPLYGTDLSNRVEFVGEARAHGGFVAPTSCRRWRELLNQGDYDYVVTSRDRLEPGKPPYPATTRWTEAPGSELVLKTPPTAIFRLTAPLDPSSCPS